MECLAHHYTERTNCCQAVGTSQGITTTLTLHWAQIVDYCKWSSHEILLKTEVQKERGDETKLPCCLAIANRVSNEIKLLHYLTVILTNISVRTGVCPIRSRLTNHCIVWIKNYNFFHVFNIDWVFLPRIYLNHRHFYNMVLDINEKLFYRRSIDWKFCQIVVFFFILLTLTWT